MLSMVNVVDEIGIDWDVFDDIVFGENFDAYGDPAAGSTLIGDASKDGAVFEPTCLNRVGTVGCRVMTP